MRLDTTLDHCPELMQRIWSVLCVKRFEISKGVILDMRHISLHCVKSASVYTKIQTAGKSTIISMTILLRLASHLASLQLNRTYYFQFRFVVYFFYSPCFLTHTLGYTLLTGEGLYIYVV